MPKLTTLEEYVKALVTDVKMLVQQHFKKMKPKKTDAQLAAQKEAMLAQIPEEQRKSISDELLDKSLDMGMVSLPHVPPISLFLPFL